jgi:transcriptional regulator of arginine metabolism
LARQTPSFCQPDFGDEVNLEQHLELILQTHAVGDQALLLAMLHARGLAITQSTLSRKLKSLGISKRDGKYVRAAAAAVKLTAVIAVAPNLLVLRTLPGFANALAVQLDENPLPGQAGTIAGDDTVFVAVAEHTLTQAQTQARVWLR